MHGRRVFVKDLCYHIAYSKKNRKFAVSKM